jgi:hypothetical protein
MYGFDQYSTNTHCQMWKDLNAQEKHGERVLSDKIGMRRRKIPFPFGVIYKSYLQKLVADRHTVLALLP